MFRKVTAVVVAFVIATAWGYAYNFVEARVEIGWVIGFCLVSVVIGALLVSMLWDWAFDRDPHR